MHETSRAGSTLPAPLDQEVRATDACNQCNWHSVYWQFDIFWHAMVFESAFLQAASAERSNLTSQNSITIQHQPWREDRTIQNWVSVDNQSGTKTPVLDMSLSFFGNIPNRHGGGASSIQTGLHFFWACRLINSWTRTGNTSKHHSLWDCGVHTNEVAIQPSILVKDSAGLICYNGVMYPGSLSSLCIAMSFLWNQHEHLFSHTEHQSCISFPCPGSQLRWRIGQICSHRMCW